ncbi:MAG: hypothetical protein QXF40_01080 [Metallosphaera sp.]
MADLGLEIQLPVGLLLVFIILLLLITGYSNPSFYSNVTYSQLMNSTLTGLSVLVSFIITKNKTIVLDILVIITLAVSFTMLVVTITSDPQVLQQQSFVEVIQVILNDALLLVSVVFGKRTT